jgi:dihydroorotate dehydrogenase (fumarate)/dihydroorotate dehydrogenase
VNVYRRLARPVLFRLDPERAHHLAMTASALLGRAAFARAATARVFGTPADPVLRTEAAGIAFPNPLGLGAGYDKNGEGVNLLSRMGFGFLEIGSVSRWPSRGNAVRPRAFRLPADDALIINYGVPNHGAEVVAVRLAAASAAGPLLVNVVETNGRPADARSDVIDEVAAAAALLAPVANALVISAECANAPGTHALLRLDNLRRLLDALAAVTAPLPPVLIKIRVSGDDIDAVLRITDAYPFVRGFRINTITPRPYAELATPSDVWGAMAGSLSSPHYSFPAMLDAVADWYRRCDPHRYALVASGGIRSGRDAYRAIRCGATLVQCVTALVYEGPSLARRINAELAALLRADGFASARDAVGIDTPLSSRA